MRLATKPLCSIAVAAALAILGVLAAPRSAAAGEYTIYACQADDAGYVSSAFEDFATRGMKWRRACDPLGPGLRGLVTANVPGTGKVARGAQSGFALDAPPGTTFSRLRWSGHAQRRDCRYALQLYAERPGASPVSIRNVRANRNCPRPDVAQASSWPRLRSYDLGGATRIVQRVVCVGAPSREFCSARGQNFIRTFAAEATVVDGTAPSVAIVQDAPITRGWVRGKQVVPYEATDNVGIKSASALVSGGVRGTEPRACLYSQRIPCPNGPGRFEIDTAEAPEGSQPLAVAAEDSAGNRAESSAVTVRIDNTAPGAVQVGVGGGEAWRNSNDFDLGWANPAEPDRAPITGAHYQLCREGGNECVNGDRAGATIAAIENLTVPSLGAWMLRLWREDEAGNQQAANASEPVRLRFDPEPPQLGFETPSAEDPTRISVRVTDRISGLGGGGIEVTRAGSGTWQVLLTSQEGDRLVTRIDDAALPPGDYELRASAHDQANNLAGTDRRLDGQPMRLRLPLRIATSMKAGVIGKHAVKGQKGKRRTVLEPRDKVAFGRRVRLGGRLVNPAGHALAGAKVLVYSQPKEGVEQLEDTVTTNPDRRFAYEVEARSSRRFRFVYQGTATILPVEDTATLLVEAASSFAVRPKHVSNGDSVTFSGSVRGRPLLEGGKLVELQWLATGEWQTFRTVRSDPDGAWRISYPFKRTCGVQTLRFRAHITGEGGYPLEPGNSPELVVRVRGRPCSTG
ncbi:MAG: hypothetical protein QOF13_883 [Solirubrobacterales bacterium]|nr:hypothetical protein [Solirubrobacterales bacterium]